MDEETARMMTGCETTLETILLLAREQEWAEAFAADHPDSDMGRLYLDFLRRELAAALSSL